MIQELALYIEAETPLALGDTLCIGVTPQEAPAEVTTLAETTGGIPNFDLPDFLQKPIQVLSRAENYLQARANAYIVYNLLHGIAGVTLPEVTTGVLIYVDTCTAVASPFYIGKDDKGLHVFSTNYVFRIQNA